MKIEKLLYCLCEYSHLIFEYLFWGYFIAMTIVRCFDIELCVIFDYLFFLLFGLWLGSTVCLSATDFMKKVHQKKLDEKNESSKK